MTQRHIARTDNPQGVASELDWINSEVRLLGKSFGAAVRSIEAAIKDGTMFVVDKEVHPTGSPAAPLSVGT